MNFVSAIRGPTERFTFIPHTGRAKNKLAGLDLFAEHLANGVSPAKAAKLAGYVDIDPDFLLKVLCDDLGPQAR